MKGSNICVIATYDPVLLYIISGLALSATSPIQTKKSFTTPCCCNKIIQLAVLTRSEVQNGRRTHIINRLLYFIGSVASKCAIGYAIKKQNKVTKKAISKVLNHNILCICLSSGTLTILPSSFSYISIPFKYF